MQSGGEGVSVVVIKGIVMGIDPSLTSTGWVVLKDGELLGHGAIKGENDGPRRLIQLETRIKYLIDEYCPGFVAIEGYAYGAANRAHQIGELGGVLRVLLHRWSQGDAERWKEYPPTVVKKFCTGKGNGKKEDMKLWAFKKWGVEFKTNDEVDAYVLARLAEKELKDWEGQANG